MSPLAALIASLNNHRPELQSAPPDAVRFTDIVYRRLADSDIFAQTVQQLTSREVQDASCDEATALRCKAEGDAAACSGDQRRAASLYSKALRYLDASTATGRKRAKQWHNGAISCMAATCNAEILIRLEHARAAGRLDGPRPEAEPSTALDYLADQPVDCEGQPQESQSSRLAALLTARAPAVEVQERTGAGRSLVAKDAISAGSIALSDLPFEIALHKRHRQQLCSQCTAPLPPVALPCGRCPLVAFCTFACREASAHRPGGCECGVPWTVLLPQDVVLASRAVRRMQVLGDGLSAHIASLEGHLQVLPFEQRLELAVLACVTAACCQERTADTVPAQPAAVQQAAAVLVALCQIAVNGVAVVPAVVRSQADRRALALYPLASLLNHSCSPNVSMSFEGSRLVVRALRDLAPGAELLHCYGPQAGEHITPLRRQLLQQQYHFHCMCEACRRGDADASGDAAQVGVRCPSDGCSGAVVLSCEAAQLTSLHSIPANWRAELCTRCDQQLPQGGRSALQSQLRQAHRLFDQASQTSDPAQATAALRECMQARRAHLHPHNELLGASADALAVALATGGKLDEAAQQCAASQDILSQSYPPDSTAVAHAKLKLAALLQRLQRGEQSARLMREALTLLRLHHGEAAAMAIVQSYQPQPVL